VLWKLWLFSNTAAWKPLVGCTWDDKVEVDCRETTSKVVDWVPSAQCWVWPRALMRTVFKCFNPFLQRISETCVMYVEMFFPVSCLGPHREHTNSMTFILYSYSVVVTVRV
jgi:hypothetical protein